MQKNVAGQKIGSQMVSATDGSAFSGTVTVYVTGDAGTQSIGSVGSGVCTHEGNGYHTYAPSQAETNYDLIAFTFIGSGAVPVTVQVVTAINPVTAVPTAAQNADAVWDEAYSGHTTAGTFGKLLNIIRKSNLSIEGTVSTAISPTTTTFSSDVSATTGAYEHAVLLFTSGVLTGENSPIISYNNTNGVFVLEESLTAAPSDGDEFVVIAGSHVHSVAAIQAGLATTAGLTEIKGAGWNSSTDTLEKIAESSGGSTVSISIPAATAQTVLDSTTAALALYRGTTFSYQFTGLGTMTTWSKVYFTVRPVKKTADAQSLIQIVVTNPSDGADGLKYLNGVATTASWGSIVVDNTSTGSITVTIKPNATTLLAEQYGVDYDVKVILSDSTIPILAFGTLSVIPDVTRAIT